jgi:hypothetical protein
LHFVKTFSTDSKSAEILRFLINFFIYLDFWALFENFEAKRAKNGKKNNKRI